MAEKFSGLDTPAWNNSCNARSLLAETRPLANNTALLPEEGLQDLGACANRWGVGSLGGKTALG